MTLYLSTITQQKRDKACLPSTYKAHAMRNEVGEELRVDREAKVMQKRTWSPSEPAKPARWRAKARKKASPAGKRGQEVSTRRSFVREERASAGEARG